MTEERKEVRRARRAANLTSTVTGTKEAPQTKAKAKAKARARPDIATLAESKDTSERTVHTSGPTAWTKKMTKVRRGRVSLTEKGQNNS